MGVLGGSPSFHGIGDLFNPHIFPWRVDSIGRGDFAVVILGATTVAMETDRSGGRRLLDHGGCHYLPFRTRAIRPRDRGD